MTVHVLPPEPEVRDWDSQLDEAILNARGVLAAAPKPLDSDQAAYLAMAWIELGTLITARQRNEFDFNSSDDPDNGV